MRGEFPVRGISAKAVSSAPRRSGQGRSGMLRDFVTGSPPDLNIAGTTSTRSVSWVGEEPPGCRTLDRPVDGGNEMACLHVTSNIMHSVFDVHSNFENTDLRAVWF